MKMKNIILIQNFQLDTEFHYKIFLNSMQLIWYHADKTNLRIPFREKESSIYPLASNKYFKDDLEVIQTLKQSWNWVDAKF
jgi:hypothetical protein